MSKMIPVPAEAFALLWAYCFTSQLEVPEHIKAHPDYPVNREQKRGHLMKVLTPYAAQAAERMRAKTPADLAAEMNKPRFFPSRIGRTE